MPRGLAAALRHGSSRLAAVRRPSDQSSFISTSWPRLRNSRTVSAGTRPSSTTKPARAGGAWPERRREVLAVPRRRVDRLLQIHAAMDVSQEHLRDPLLLLVAARRAPAHGRFAVAMGERRGEGCARPLARRHRTWLPFLEPADLAARADREAELRNDRR